MEEVAGAVSMMLLIVILLVYRPRREIDIHGVGTGDSSTGGRDLSGLCLGLSKWFFVECVASGNWNHEDSFM